MLRERLLSALLLVDGLIAIGFGLASWLDPQATCAGQCTLTVANSSSAALP